MGWAAFSGCTALTDVTIPGSIEEIPTQIFAECENLINLTIKHGVKIIDVEAFQNCKKLETISIPASVTTMRDGAFGGCISLKYVTLSSDLYKKRGTAFKGCSSLTEQGFTIVNLASNPMTLKGKTAKVKYKKVKKKNQVLSFTKVVTFKKKGQGTLSYKKVSGNKKIVINSKTGKVTVKKKLKRGTYKVTAKVLAAGTDTVKSSGWKKVTFKIRVK